MAEVDKTLQDRGARYGDFASHARATVAIKEAIYGNCVATLAPHHREALDMIAHKIGRIVNGDPNYADSWHDIAGYAVLVEKIINSHASTAGAAR